MKAALNQTAFPTQAQPLSSKVIDEHTTQEHKACGSFAKWSRNGWRLKSNNLRWGRRLQNGSLSCSLCPHITLQVKVGDDRIMSLMIVIWWREKQVWTVRNGIWGHAKRIICRFTQFDCYTAGERCNWLDDWDRWILDFITCTCVFLVDCPFIFFFHPHIIATDGPVVIDRTRREESFELQHKFVFL